MKKMTIEAKDEAIVVAERIKNSSEWIMDDCKELCDLAGLSDEWENADGETFESVVYEAAEILGVEIF